MDRVDISATPDGLLLLSAVYRTQAFPRHTHATFVVGINERSAHRFWCRGMRHVVPPGTIALVNPEEVHTGESDGVGEWRYRGFYPTAEWMRPLWLELRPQSADVPMFPRPAVRDGELAVGLRAFHRMASRSSDPLGVESAGVGVFTRLLRRHAEGARSCSVPRRETHRVSRMREFLHANLAKPITLAMLAEVAGLGRSGALGAFRRELGIPPYEYLTSIRLEHARGLLMAGERIAVAAQIAGFADQSHLTRRFRRQFGVTPGAFARAVQGSSNIVLDSQRSEPELVSA